MFGTTMGLGQRSDFTKLADIDGKPGPGHHNAHEVNTIGKNSIDNSSRHRSTSFANGFDKYSKICYKGMEQSYYLTQSAGPGAYMGQNNVKQSHFKSATQFSIPKVDRGLLSFKDQKLPGPANYKHEHSFQKFSKRQANCTIGNQTRDIPFSKYS